MEELDRYVEYIKQIIQQKSQEENEPLKEDEIVMLVYLDLGKRFHFDVDVMLGTKKIKEQIYRKNCLSNKLDEIFQSGRITCKSSAKILEYVLKKLGVNITTEEYDSQNAEYRHSYNVVYPIDKSTPYKIDLQNDLKNIQFHTRTKKFGLSLYDEKYVVSLKRQKEIHKRIGYVSNNIPYTEEYVYFLKYNANLIDDTYEKLDFVLANIDPSPEYDIKYWERSWRHKEVLEYIFDKSEIKRILNGVICYKTNDENIREYLNCYFIYHKGKTFLYLYDKQSFSYIKYDLDEFVKKLQEEKIEISPDTKIPNLKKVQRECIKK